MKQIKIRTDKCWIDIIFLQRWFAFLLDCLWTGFRVWLSSCWGSSFTVQSSFRPWLTFHWPTWVRSIIVSFCTFRFWFYRHRTWPGPFIRGHLRVPFSFFSFEQFFTWGLTCTWWAGRGFRHRAGGQGCFWVRGKVFTFHEWGFLWPILLKFWQWVVLDINVWIPL